ncbi:MAG TPA: LTA synthase family protein, partial [Turneriella sp.]|nr:LTA synthase family protein [Turneriella sp.]
KAAPVFILMFATIVGFLYSRFLIGRRASRYLLWSAGFIFLFITLLTLTAPDAAALTEKKVRFDFKTIFTNPLSELSHYFFKTAQPNRILENQSNNGINPALAQSPLARYNTDSPTHARIFPRIAFQRSHKYNIVFYFLESTSYAYKNLKYNGMDIMPNLKALYEKGFATQKHYANFPLSINTFYTVLTAAYQYPDKNFIPCSRPQIPVPTIYETLKGAGFQTAVFHGSSLDNFCRRDFLKNRHVDAQVGFGELDKMQYPPIDATWQADDRAMINPFIEFMKQKPKKSKFAVVMPISPHHPYLVPSEQFNITKKELERNQGRKEQYWLQYINSLYFSDFVLGEFIKAMEKNHLLKNTVLFIFGDHGEAFYQHAGNYLHSLFVYEENVRVPFVILNPVLFPQKIHYDGISRMIDIAPTALDIVGVKAPKHYQGLSLLSTHRQQYALLHTQWADDMMGIVDGNNKYIYRFADGFEELYNLSNDPTEKNNLATHERRLVDQYRSLVLNGRKASQEFYRALH